MQQTIMNNSSIALIKKLYPDYGNIPTISVHFPTDAADVNGCFDIIDAHVISCVWLGEKFPFSDFWK